MDALVMAYGPGGIILAWIAGEATKEVRGSWAIWLLRSFAAISVLVGLYLSRMLAGKEKEQASDAWLKMACRMVGRAVEHEYLVLHKKETSVCVSPYHVRGAECVQIFEVGDSPSYEPRHIPAKCGAVGEAVYRRSFVVGVRKGSDEETFRRQLREDYGLPPEVINTVRPDMYSWIAVPLFGHDQRTVELVIFVDSNRRDCFPELSNEGEPTGISESVVRLCSSIADHMVEYGS